MRASMLQTIRDSSRWDLAVIGGGATGLGTAVDAASRGYRTLVLEAHDFAQGTSSRSTKLIHGGVRYLARGEVGLVREALRERGRLLRNAPHLVHARAFLVPAYTRFDLLTYGIGLKLYDSLAGKQGMGPSRWIDLAEALRLAPTLEPEGLRGGVVYYDGQFDDARLAMTLVRTLLDLGGTALNYLPVTGLVKTQGQVAGVLARDEETGEEFAIHARAVVNATGVYVDGVRRLDDPVASALIRPSRGAHLVLSRDFLPGETAVMIPRTVDGRVIFLIPWYDHVVVGTTDTPVDDTPIEPRPSREDVAFLLSHAARYLSRDPRPEDILSQFAGLRPLLRRGGAGATARLSREHSVVVSDAGLVTVTGGKWTTYRPMGSDAVDRVSVVGGLPRRPSATESLRLHGATESPWAGPMAVHGTEAPEVARLLRSQPGWSEPLHSALPYRMGEVVWAVRHELARTVEDVLARRTRALLLNARASMEAAPRVAKLMARELGRDESWCAAQVREFRAVAADYLPG